jgi:ankyrin repeat protein
MIACQYGYLEMVEYLIDNAKLPANGRDKLKKTPLLHAVANGLCEKETTKLKTKTNAGQSHIVSYLLRRGVDADAADSSGNTPAHYACAYGW